MSSRWGLAFVLVLMDGAVRIPIATAGRASQMDGCYVRRTCWHLQLSDCIINPWFGFYGRRMGADWNASIKVTPNVEGWVSFLWNCWRGGGRLISCESWTYKNIDLSKLRILIQCTLWWKLSKYKAILHTWQIIWYDAIQTPLFVGTQDDLKTPLHNRHLYLHKMKAKMKG